MLANEGGRKTGKADKEVGLVLKEWLVWGHGHAVKGKDGGIERTTAWFATVKIKHFRKHSKLNTKRPGKRRQHTQQNTRYPGLSTMGNNGKYDFELATLNV